MGSELMALVCTKHGGREKYAAFIQPEIIENWKYGKE